MSDRFRIKAAACAILRDEKGRILFMRRHGTGYMDDMLGLPSGHIEQNESFQAAAVRELKEEADVDMAMEKFDHAVTLHRYQSLGEDDYVDVFFVASEWSGVPKIAEPDKCSEIVWAHPDDVQDELVPYLVYVFDAIAQQKSFIELRRGDDE